ncbi:MAG: penicillin-binding protein [Thalassobius sp.]|nr:penicillin-binding protein [Thalassovita sp.]
MKFFLLVTFLIVSVSSLTTISAQSTQAPKHTESISQKIDSLFAEWNNLQKPGATVAVVSAGEIVFEKGYGSANLEYDIPNTPSTIFHVASVSKQFTAFSILLLEADGKLSLDDDVRKYIPEVPDFVKTITLRHLATHTSGLRDQWNLLIMAGWRFDDVITLEHVLKLISKQKALNFEPGEEYLYCNSGFTLLAEVVARVSGKSFAEFTKERIFGPLKMSNSLFYDDHEKIVKNRSYSYYDDGGTYKKSVLSYANVGATSLFTTVEDLSLWTMNFIDPKVGNKEIIDKMNTLAVLNNGKTFGGALGQFVSNYKGLNQISHGGADAGYRTFLLRYPDQEFAVVVLSNLANFNPGGLANQVADLYLENYFAIPEKEEKPKVKYKKLKAEKLATFSGNYWQPKEYYSRKIYVKNDTLRYFRWEGNESDLLPISDNEFRMQGDNIDLTVQFENNGDQKFMNVIENKGEPLIFESFDSVAYTPEELENFTGLYYSEELETTLNFVVENDKLIAKHIRMSTMEFNPIKKDTFQSSFYAYHIIDFIRNSSGMVIGFKASNGRVRNLLFNKL